MVTDHMIALMAMNVPRVTKGNMVTTIAYPKTCTSSNLVMYGRIIISQQLNIIFGEYLLYPNWQ